MARAQPDIREELRILTTQIETINQQLAGGVGGGSSGSDPALRTQLAQIEKKLDFLYSFSKGIQDHVTASVQSSLEHLSSSVKKTLNDNLTQVFAQLETIEKSPGGVGGEGISQVRSSLKSLLDVYKDEVEVFKEQNAFLQQQLEKIDKRLNKP